MPFYSRKTPRLPNFDYSSVNYYFITVCTQERACIFGTADQLNALGTIAERDIVEIPAHYQGVKIDKFVVMPNHIHMILVLNGETVVKPTVSRILALYKAGVSRKIKHIRPDIQVWQRSFHEHVIRNRTDYENIWNYIENNPVKWKEDMFYPNRQN